jgi:protease-4
LTGSIGVLGGKIALGKMWDKLDVQWDSSIRWGDNAGLWSMNEPFSPAQKERVDAMLDQIYDAFLQRVSEGRGMSLAEVDKIARGRVWPGAKAKELGLVDEIGGLNDAVAYTAQKLGLPDAQSLTLVQMPRPLSPLEKLAKLLGEQGLVFDALRLQAALGHYVSPALRSMDQQATLANGAATTYMDWQLQ